MYIELKECINALEMGSGPEDRQREHTGLKGSILKRNG